MKQYKNARWRILLLLLLLVSCASEQKQSSKKFATAKPEHASASALPWKIPTQIPSGPAGDAIRRGEALLTQTAQYLGPDVPDPAKRIAGNHMACKNCHLNAGKQAHALGFFGISARFPQYRARENREITLAERVNGCFERSLNGRSLPVDSPEMQAILAYMDWLSQGVPQGARVEGQGLPPITLLDRAANPEKGKVIYANRCALCHQPTGAGLLVDPQKPARGYIYPPLWGPDSFNNGAGMARLITAARYIKANMPLGNPTLSDEEAFDVAAYINSQPRPQRAGLEKDFPDRSKKPVDAPFPPWPGNFPPEQHKYGPFKPMMNSKAQ